jgi:hypothetical protein
MLPPTESTFGFDLPRSELLVLVVGIALIALAILVFPLTG